MPLPHAEAPSCDPFANAHIPSLICALVHLTGDASRLDGPQPVYEFFGDGQGGLPEALQAEVRSEAARVTAAISAGTHTPPAAPSRETIRRMMDFAAGAVIPDHYAPFLMDELAVDDADAKAVDKVAPALKTASRKLKVVVIGAGMSGLLSAIRLQQAGVDYEVIEKNADVGGTWLENTYPGVRVDTPNHLYSYSFEPNHDWPQHYSTGDVLLRYFQRTADKYDLRGHIRFETTVEECAYDEAAAKWRLRIKGPDGGHETLVADAVISAVGQLNQPRYPDTIQGFGTFEGPAFHSARWDHAVDLAGKRVAVIGTGASAFQFVPEIASEVASLKVFQRTPPWLGPTPNYHDTVPAGKQWLLENVPYYEKWYRFWLYWTMTDGLYEAVKADADWAGPEGTVGEANAMLRGLLAEKILEQTEGRSDLAAAVLPTYPYGGKRSLRDNGVWIGALRRDNVELVTTGITEITASGVRTVDGTLHEVDVLIYGTGFYASDFLRTFKIVGRGGKELHDQWRGDARAYLGMTAPGFPNFFILYGPNTNIVVNGSIIFFSECSVRYVLGCLELLAKTGAQAIEVKREVHDAFNDRVDAANAKMAWGAAGVSSWYKNETGRVSQNWPFPLVDYWNATLKPDEADFTLR